MENNLLNICDKHQIMGCHLGCFPDQTKPIELDANQPLCLCLPQPCKINHRKKVDDACVLDIAKKELAHFELMRNLQDQGRILKSYTPSEVAWLLEQRDIVSREDRKEKDLKITLLLGSDEGRPDAYYDALNDVSARILNYVDNQ